MTNELQALTEELQRLDRLGSISGLLMWDEQVNMPAESSPLRAEQQGHYSELLHREMISPNLESLIAAAEGSANGESSEEQVILREARKEYDRLQKIPAEFASRKARACSNGFHAWVKAREQDDFQTFLPHLKEQIELVREEASLVCGEDQDFYDYWLDRFDPGMTTTCIDQVFTPLRTELKPIVEEILNSPVQPENSIFRGFPVESQKNFLLQVVDAMGFDFQRGRIDSAVHPFCSGHPADTRMTTRYDPDNPLDSWSSAMHETGHALYQQGLPPDRSGTALGQPVGMAVHESQSRIWENQVGRSRAFWQFWEPKYREAFSAQLANVDSETLFLAINRVALTPIRVDADEVTYNLHIMLRYELEKQLLNGSLNPVNLPDAWNALSTEILGYTPKNNREGCLQDVHWSEGLFGYFPSYCLGNLLAAQLWYSILDQIPDLEDSIAQGDMQPLLNWLREHVHQLGRQFYTEDFTKHVTGTELSHKFLVRYLKERYLPLYTTS